MNNYPSIKEVKEAHRTQICWWYRYLYSPGQQAIGADNFREILEKEGKIIDLIVEKFRINWILPKISKLLSYRKIKCDILNY